MTRCVSDGADIRRTQMLMSVPIPKRISNEARYCLNLSSFKWKVMRLDPFRACDSGEETCIYRWCRGKAAQQAAVTAHLHTIRWATITSINPSMHPESRPPPTHRSSVRPLPTHTPTYLSFKRQWQDEKGAAGNRSDNTSLAYLLLWNICDWFVLEVDMKPSHTCGYLSYVIPCRIFFFNRLFFPCNNYSPIKVQWVPAAETDNRSFLMNRWASGRNCCPI